ncbi:MAG TPA: hypothetical protein PLG63_01745, partial [bacterium]|nr:hypothetical protein [bacterium]
FELLNKRDFSGMVAYAISDEIAVEKFLKNEIKIKDIHEIVALSVEKFAGRLTPSSIQEIEEFIDEIEIFAREVL